MPAFDRHVLLDRWSKDTSPFNFSLHTESDYIGRVRKSYNKCKGKDLDIYAYLMRKSLGSDTEKSGTPAARKKLLGHKSEYTAGRWYSSADDEDVLSSMWNRDYLHDSETAINSRIGQMEDLDQNMNSKK